MLISHWINTDCILSNIFGKSNEKLASFKQNSLNVGPPWDRTRYETLDYILTQNRWKNNKNVEIDPYTNIDTDHLTLIADIEIKLKAIDNVKIKMRDNTKMHIKNAIWVQ